MAWIVLIFLLYGDARSRKHLVPSSVFYLTSLCRKTIWILRLADADGGNRTRATSAASDRAIHYTIAPRPLKVYFFRSTSFSFDYEMKRTELSARWTERNQRSQPTLVPAKQINLMELFSSSFVAEVFFVSSLHRRQWRHRQEKWSRLSTAGIYIYWNMLRRC